MVSLTDSIFILTTDRPTLWSWPRSFSAWRWSWGQSRQWPLTNIQKGISGTVGHMLMLSRSNKLKNFGSEVRDKAVHQTLRTMILTRSILNTVWMEIETNSYWVGQSSICIRIRGKSSWSEIQGTWISLNCGSRRKLWMEPVIKYSMVDWSIILCANNHKTGNGTGTGRRTVTLPAPRFFFWKLHIQIENLVKCKKLERKSTAKQVCNVHRWSVMPCLKGMDMTVAYIVHSSGSSNAAL